MKNKYLSKIIAKDTQGLKLISAYCFEAKADVKELKYLKKNQIFLVLLERFKKDNVKSNKKINSICKFEFVENVKSKNVNQYNKDSFLELIAIDLFKNRDKYEINLFFNNNACITLLTEIIEVTLEDQSNN